MSKKFSAHFFLGILFYLESETYAKKLSSKSKQNIVCDDNFFFAYGLDASKKNKIWMKNKMFRKKCWEFFFFHEP